MKTLIIMILTLSLGISQDKKPKPPAASPRATLSQVVGYNKVTIDYGRPAVKGRTVYGNLVKYDKVWRTGANEQSEIEFAEDMMVNGKKVMKGRYSLFTVPKKGNKWTVILNKDLGKWGAFSYNEANDLMRFDVDIMSTSNEERLSFTFDIVGLKESHLVFAWGDKMFKVKIVDFVEPVIKKT